MDPVDQKYQDKRTENQSHWYVYGCMHFHLHLHLTAPITVCHISDRRLIGMSELVARATGGDVVTWWAQRADLD
jgi:hypothetical protein